MAKFEYEILHPKRVNASLLHEEMTNRFAEVFTGVGYNANSLRLRFDRGLTTEEISDTIDVFHLKIIEVPFRQIQRIWQSLKA